MTKNQTNNIGKLLVENAVAITPIVIEVGRAWLEGRGRNGSSSSRKRKPKSKAG